MPSTTASRPRRRAWALIATALGALLFGLLGSGALGATAPGEGAFIVQNSLGLLGATCLAVGVVGMRGPLDPEGADRLLRWGVRLAWIGLAATAAAHALAIATTFLGGPAAEAAVLVGVPLIVAAHLLYPGTSLVGAALLRGRGVPAWLGLLLAASLPIVLIGVPVSIPLGAEGIGAVVAWIATEGQVGAAWLLLAVLLATRAGSRRGQMQVRLP